MWIITLKHHKLINIIQSFLECLMIRTKREVFLPFFMMLSIGMVFLLVSCGLTAIKVKDNSISISKGERYPLSVQEEGLRSLGETVYFASDDTNIVLVDEIGILYGKKVGTTTINIFSSYKYDVNTNVKVRVMDSVEN